MSDTTNILFEQETTQIFTNQISEQIYQAKLRFQQTSRPTTPLPSIYSVNETSIVDEDIVTSNPL